MPQIRPVIQHTRQENKSDLRKGGWEKKSKKLKKKEDDSDRRIAKTLNEPLVAAPVRMTPIGG